MVVEVRVMVLANFVSGERGARNLYEIVPVTAQFRLDDVIQV